MAAKKESSKTKKVHSSKKPSIEKLRTQHPFETDSQIQNRYGKGREKSGSDGSDPSGRGRKH